MHKAFVLILLTFANESQVKVEAPNLPLMVFDTRAECEEMGEGSVEDSIRMLQGKGATFGSVWYYCQEVSGRLIGKLP